MRSFFGVFLTCALLIVLLAPVFALAQACASGEKLCGSTCVPEDDICLNLSYPKFGPFNLNINQNLAEIIAYLYYFIVGIAALSAFVMLVWGGVQWLVSGAAPSMAGEARDKIRNAIIGLLLVVSSFLIVQVINPELTVLSGSIFEPVDCTKLREGACDPLRMPTPVFGLDFTVNGGKSATVDSGNSAELAWNVDPAFDRCDGTSDPGGLWTVTLNPADFRGSATVGPITTSPTFFMLDCYRPGFGTTMHAILPVGVASAGPPEPLPVVDLKVDPDRVGPLERSDGPLTVPAVPDVDVYLFTSNATKCFGGPELVGGVFNGAPITDPEFNTKVRRGPYVGYPPPYQVIFDVTCFNATGQSARDEVIMNILEP